MGLCNAETTRLLEEMKQEGILLDIDPDKAPSALGTLWNVCGDGEHSDDAVAFHMKIHKGRCRHHLIASNGGLLQIPVDSPLNRNHRGQNMLEDIVDGLKLKDIETVVLQAHWPCGAAGLANLSLVQYLELCLAAKHRVREYLEAETGVDDPNVLLYFHAAYSTNRKRTYRVDPPALRTWLEKRGVRAA